MLASVVTRAIAVSRRLAKVVGLTGLTALLLALGVGVPAQAQEPTKAQYKLVDVGTFGGPQAGVGNQPFLNRRGVVGTADTSLLDPFGANDSDAFNGDPFVQHAYFWRRGVLTDLGALLPSPSANSSYSNGVNRRGHVAGLSGNGIVDPLIGKIATHAVLWRNGNIADLGALGGYESQAFAINDRDQVVGVAGNAIPDAFSMLGWGTQARAFLWQHGKMRDLGTLGGPDSFAWSVNAAGQVAGVSYTSSVADPVTGQPSIDVFLWESGRMRDLGSLGGGVGVFGGVVAVNARGEVVGQSDLPGHQSAHPYLWSGGTMIDLGTLGGENGSASALNDAGMVAGTADLANDTHHAFLWVNGHLQDLQPADGAPCSNASGMNARADVVGSSADCQGNRTAALWRHGVPVDLNTLVGPSPNLRLTDTFSITDTGVIVGEGVTSNGDQHNFVLIPTHFR